MHDIHGGQCGTSPLMCFGVYRGQHTVGDAKSLVPSFLVEMDVLGIELVEES